MPASEATLLKRIITERCFLFSKLAPSFPKRKCFAGLRFGICGIPSGWCRGRCPHRPGRMHRFYGNLRRIRNFWAGRCGHRPLRLYWKTAQKTKLQTWFAVWKGRNELRKRLFIMQKRARRRPRPLMGTDLPLTAFRRRSFPRSRWIPGSRACRNRGTPASRSLRG